MSRVAASSFALCALLLATPALAESDAKKKKEEPQLKVGDEAPKFTLKVMNPKLSGQRVFSLRKYVGARAETEKTVVLSFAASWCEPCKKELTALAPRAADFAKANVVFAVVVTDTEAADAEKMRKFTAEELKLTYPVLSDRFGLLKRRYQAEQLPKTVVIRPDGKIKYIAHGFKDDSVQALEKQLGL